MKEIIVDKNNCPEKWVVSRRRAEPARPEVFEQVLKEVCEGVRVDRLEMQHDRVGTSLTPTKEIILRAA